MVETLGLKLGSKITVSCASVSTALGACSDSQTQTPSITLSSGSDSTVSVFYRVEYSLDGGSNWTELKNDEEVAANSSETYSGPALNDGESIQWRYSSRKSGGSHDSSTWITEDTDIPGVDPTLSYTASCVVTTTTTTQQQLLLQLQQHYNIANYYYNYILNRFLNPQLLTTVNVVMMEAPPFGLFST